MFESFEEWRGKQVNEATLSSDIIKQLEDVDFDEPDKTQQKSIKKSLGPVTKVYFIRSSKNDERTQMGVVKTRGGGIGIALKSGMSNWSLMPISEADDISIFIKNVDKVFSEIEGESAIDKGDIANKYL